MEIYRKVLVCPDKICIKLENEKGDVYTINGLVAAIARKYNLDWEKLRESCQIINKYLKKYNDELLWIDIEKDTGDLRIAIKQITDDLEKLIREIVNAAITLKKEQEKQNLQNWIWENAKYDWRKKKFIPVTKP